MTNNLSESEMTAEEFSFGIWECVAGSATWDTDEVIRLIEEDRIYARSQGEAIGREKGRQELADDADELAEALFRVKQWADAYPETVFTEPDFDRMRKVLSEAGMPTALDAAHGTWGRHIASGVGEIATAALGARLTKTKEPPRNG